MKEKSIYEVLETDTFVRWIEGIKDCVYRQKIAAQILKLATGNFGNVKSLKDGLYEAKEKKGAGFRLYFINRGMGKSLFCFVAAINPVSNLILKMPENWRRSIK